MSTTEVYLAPKRYHITIVKGDTVEIIFPMQTAGGDDADLSGYSVESDLVGRRSGTRTPFTATITASRVTLALTAAQTELLDSVGEFDIRLTKAATVITPAAGVVLAEDALTDLS